MGGFSRLRNNIYLSISRVMVEVYHSHCTRHQNDKKDGKKEHFLYKSLKKGENEMCWGFKIGIVWGILEKWEN